MILYIAICFIRRARHILMENLLTIPHQTIHIVSHPTATSGPPPKLRVPRMMQVWNSASTSHLVTVALALSLSQTTHPAFFRDFSLLIDSSCNTWRISNHVSNHLFISDSCLPQPVFFDCSSELCCSQERIRRKSAEEDGVYRTSSFSRWEQLLFFWSPFGHSSFYMYIGDCSWFSCHTQQRMVWKQCDSSGVCMRMVHRRKPGSSGYWAKMQNNEKESPAKTVPISWFIHHDSTKSLCLFPRLQTARRHFCSALFVQSRQGFVITCSG